MNISVEKCGLYKKVSVDVVVWLGSEIIMIRTSLIDNFLIEYFSMLHNFLLLQRQSTEELNLLLVGRLPLIVNFECRLEVLFNFDIECLRLHVDEWRVVNTWDGFGGHQVMKVACKLSELSTRRLFLTLLLLDVHLALVLLKLLAHLLVLVLHVAQISLACVEVMLILPAVVTSITIPRRLVFMKKLLKCDVTSIRMKDSVAYYF